MSTPVPLVFATRSDSKLTAALLFLPFYSVLLSVVMAAINLTMLAPYSIDFSRAAAAAAKLFSMVDRVSAIDPFDPSGEIPSETIGRVDLENISFAYPTRPGVTVLDDFTLEVPAGKVTALVVSSLVKIVSLVMVRCRTNSSTIGPIWIGQEHHCGSHRTLV